jgi:hypothetical protein
LSYDYSSQNEFDVSEGYDQIIEDDSGAEVLPISLWKKIRIRVFGSAYLNDMIINSDSDPLPIYLFKCPVHGIQKNYPSGWKKYLKCPVCMSEIL